MPCNAMTLTAEQKQAKQKALDDLERQLQSGKVTVKQTGPKVEFVGWETDRENPAHWHDDCAFHTLQAKGSSALRMALARQQAMGTATRQTLIR